LTTSNSILTVIKIQIKLFELYGAQSDKPIQPIQRCCRWLRNRMRVTSSHHSRYHLGHHNHTNCTPERC